MRYQWIPTWLQIQQASAERSIRIHAGHQRLLIGPISRLENRYWMLVPGSGSYSPSPVCLLLLLTISSLRRESHAGRPEQRAVQLSPSHSQGQGNPTLHEPGLSTNSNSRKEGAQGLPLALLGSGSCGAGVFALCAAAVGGECQTTSTDVTPAWHLGSLKHAGMAVGRPCLRRVLLPKEGRGQRMRIPEHGH